MATALPGCLFVDPAGSSVSSATRTEGPRALFPRLPTLKIQVDATASVVSAPAGPAVSLDQSCTCLLEPPSDAPWPPILVAVFAYCVVSFPWQLLYSTVFIDLRNPGVTGMHISCRQSPDILSTRCLMQASCSDGVCLSPLSQFFMSMPSQPDIHAIMHLRGYCRVPDIVLPMTKLANKHDRFRRRMVYSFGAWYGETMDDFDVTVLMREVTVDGADPQADFNKFVAKVSTAGCREQRQASIADHKYQGKNRLSLAGFQHYYPAMHQVGVTCCACLSLVINNSMRHAVVYTGST